MRKLFFGEEREERLRQVERQVARMERRVRSLMRLVLQTRFANTALHAPDFDASALSLHSQHAEDGVLIQTFSEIGVRHHSFVEIGIQDGLECNTACFALAFGWHGVMFEGGKEYAARARSNYASIQGVTIRQAFVTRENIQTLFDESGVDRDCDLFSLDIDGNDFWIWQALTGFSPRVVIVEYNRWFGFDRAVSIPYSPDFRHRGKAPRGYCGASLPAFRKLGEQKGYVLTAVCGCNAVFVRKSELMGGLREIGMEQVDRSLPATPRTEQVLSRIRDLPLVDV